MGCEYWRNWYANLFDKGMNLDSDDLSEIVMRLNISPEIITQGAEDVAAHIMTANKQGLTDIKREARLVILGSAGSGKTTLVRRLDGDMSYPDHKDSTHGVDTSVKLDCSGVKTHVWDFGGQVIYHASHRCFISANCIYVLVVNARTEDNRDSSRINYWLDTIRIYSDNKAKVFIVLNESDNRKQDVDEFDSLKDGEYGPLIQEIYSFNIGEDMASVNAFKNELVTYIEAFGHQPFGKGDSEAITKLGTLFDKGEKVLETSKLRDILENSGIRGKKDQDRAVGLLDTLGIALSYGFMKGFVLDPYWITHGVYKVIDHLQEKKSLFINDSELGFVFEDERGNYLEKKREYILDLMEHHRIGFRNKGGLLGLAVPCAAPRYKPKDVVANVAPDNLVTQVERDDIQEFPADFFYRYTCANENDIKKYGEKWAIWQEGMVLEGEGSSALVELKENRRIEITVWGENKVEYMNNLERLIDDLLQEYHFTSYEEERKKGNKTVKIIILVVKEAAGILAKAAIKAGLELFIGK